MRPSGIQGLWDPVLYGGGGRVWEETGGFFLFKNMGVLSRAMSLAVHGYPGLHREDISAV